MPLNESNRKSRDRWPLAFDLAGVPQDTALRERLLEQHKDEERQIQSEVEDHPMNEIKQVQNSFAVDYQAGNNVVDINNPPQKRYVHQEFPKLMYDHDGGRVLQVKDEREMKAALKKGFQVKPDPNRDYSQAIRSGSVAPSKPEAPEPVLSDEDLLAADDE